MIGYAWTGQTSTGEQERLANADKSLGWGEGTTDEMCIAFLRVTVDAERLGVRSR